MTNLVLHSHLLPVFGEESFGSQAILMLLDVQDLLLRLLEGNENKKSDGKLLPEAD